jgi:hypothetical protein
MPQIEVYQCFGQLPQKPPFIRLVWANEGQDLHLLEVLPDHEQVRDYRARGINLVQQLRRMKFRRASFLWAGESTDLLTSGFMTSAYYCEGCRRFHGGQIEPSAYEQYWRLPALQATAEMTQKYGVLSNRPTLKNRSKKSRPRT